MVGRRVGDGWVGVRVILGSGSSGAVGDGEGVGGAGDGEEAAVVHPVVVGADEHQVEQLGGAAVFPVPEVVCVQSAGGVAAGKRRSGGGGVPVRGVAGG